jgi:hypothetical protein
MSRDYLTHWIIGAIAALVWFWGDRAGIPKEAQVLAATIVPSLIGHALGKSSNPTQPENPAQPKE